jgi:hypothetical protein
LTTALNDWFIHCQKTTPGVVLEGENEEQLKFAAVCCSYTNANILVTVLVHMHVSKSGF